MRVAIFTVCALVGIFVAVSTTPGEEAETPVWQEGAYSAWRSSQETGRPLLLFIVSDHCPYCKLMDRNTFSDRGVLAKLRDSFVAARVDATKHPELAQKLQIQAYPTTIVVDKDNRVVGAIPGYLEPREFERRLVELETSAAPR